WALSDPPGRPACRSCQSQSSIEGPRTAFFLRGGRGSKWVDHEPFGAGPVGCVEPDQLRLAAWSIEKGRSNMNLSNDRHLPFSPKSKTNLESFGAFGGPGAPLTYGPAADDDYDIVSLIAALRRHKLFIFAWVGLILLVAGFGLSAVTPRYTARGVLMLNTRQQNVVNIQSVVQALPADRDVVQSEVDLLRSRPLVQQVIARLDLAKDPEFNNTLITGPSQLDRI